MGAKILVIDDEADIRLLARFMLEPLGHHVLEAGTGADGIAKAQADIPDMMLLDIRLPDMEGWEVLHMARSDEGIKDVPIVMMSAHASGHTMKRALDAGCRGYLVKPFREAELLGWVEELT